LGAILWQKLYGGAGSEEAFSIQKTSNGGYIILGNTTYSNGTGDVLSISLFILYFCAFEIK
jgi:hypothetical protein